MIYLKIINAGLTTRVHITDSIAYCARVSNPANQSNTETNMNGF